MKKTASVLSLLGIFALAGCSGDGGTTTGCDPACDASACMVCDTSGETPTCVSACGEGTSCQDGLCVPPEQVTCEPACSACQVCDTSGAQPVCRDVCAEGLECVDGVCQPPAEPTCEPACGPCQTCDTSGDTPVCTDNCGEGLQCQDGVCVAPPEVVCEPACGECQMCDTSGVEPVCVNLCGEGEYCDAGTCRRESIHAHMEALEGPFASGSEVTAACLQCHTDEAGEVMASLHFTWGTTNHTIEGKPADFEVGKKNLINNFCIAVVSNEKRCTQCHAGYGWENSSFDFSEPTNIDCLVCHADPRSGYKKDPKNAGRPVADVDLVVAARSVGKPTRQNCGACHFNAGGGDNVKKGDIGSALANPTADADVHMGQGMSCADCHRGDNHTLLGLGAHLPVSEGRVSCTDCHSDSPHSNDLLNNHALDVACQTCHVPAFSRQQPTKMDWDWSTAGNRTIGNDGIEMGTLEDGTQVVTYHYMKGSFVWKKNVRPVYAWDDGRVSRMTILDTFPAGQGSSADNPVHLGYPVATKDDAEAKITPFKVMTGRTPGHLTDNYMIVPKLFGPGGFWAGIPDAASYTPEAVQALWTQALNAGALAAGQITNADSIADSDWGWLYTDLYLRINHEVAPASQALGCNDCHNGAQGFSFTDLGYTCDPMTGGPSCGSRH